MTTTDTALKSSWELKELISNLKLPTELRNQIDIYIAKYTKSGKTNSFDYPFTNIFFRGNLQYILDNIRKPKLLIELQKLNSK